MGWFSKSVKLEDQLARFAELGITQNADTLESDLFAFHTKDELEKKPFKLLAEALGMDIEREPWTPISDRLWMCDFERIEGPGSYQSVIARLERMTHGVLGLTNIKDHVVQFEEDLEDEAWVEFEHRGEAVRWELKVEDDWLDPAILQKYDALLEQSADNHRLFANFSDYGQVAFLAAFTPSQHKRFRKLTGIKMEPAH